MSKLVDRPLHRSNRARHGKSEPAGGSSGHCRGARGRHGPTWRLAQCKQLERWGTLTRGAAIWEAQGAKRGGSRAAPGRPGAQTVTNAAYRVMYVCGALPSHGSSARTRLGSSGLSDGRCRCVDSLSCVEGGVIKPLHAPACVQ